MNIESYRDYCLSKPGTTEHFPFDENTLVFKVMGKMYALTDVTTFEYINLKCDPELAVSLREQYDSVLPGYHMSKANWNSVVMGLGLPDALIVSWIDHSYDLVVAGLPKKDKELLKKLSE